MLPAARAVKGADASAPNLVAESVRRLNPAARAKRHTTKSFGGEGMRMAALSPDSRVDAASRMPVRHADEQGRNRQLHTVEGRFGRRRSKRRHHCSHADAAFAARLTINPEFHHSRHHVEALAWNRFAPRGSLSARPGRASAACSPYQWRLSGLEPFRAPRTDVAVLAITLPAEAVEPPTPNALRRDRVEHRAFDRRAGRWPLLRLLRCPASAPIRQRRIAATPTSSRRCSARSAR